MTWNLIITRCHGRHRARLTAVLIPTRGRSRVGRDEATGRSRQSVLHDDSSNLFHLIGFGLSTPGLQIQSLLNSLLGEDVMIATNTLSKPQPFQEITSIPKGDGGIRGAAQDAIEESIVLGHATSYTTFAKRSLNALYGHSRWCKGV